MIDSFIDDTPASIVEGIDDDIVLLIEWK